MHPPAAPGSGSLSRCGLLPPRGLHAPTPGGHASHKLEGGSRCQRREPGSRGSCFARTRHSAWAMSHAPGSHARSNRSRRQRHVGRKRDVSDPARCGENRQLNSVSKTSGVENTPKCYLNSSALLPDAAHPSARLRGGGVSPSARSHVVGFSHAPPPRWYAPGSRTPGCSRQWPVRGPRAQHCRLTSPVL